jgi:hypothetical protein
MKIFTIIFGLLFLAVPAFAQTPPYQLLSGYWNTNNDKRITVITTHALEATRVFKISASGTRASDGSEAEYTVIADGMPLNGVLSGGTTIFVEARSIAIKKLPTGNTVSTGTWEIVQEEPIVPTSGLWVSVLGVGKRKSMAIFKTPQEFVIDIPPTSVSGTPAQLCMKATMNFYVENVPIKDNEGSIVDFPIGSSIIGKAKEITSVIKTAQCGGQPNAVGVSAIIKIHPRKTNLQ